MYWLEFIISAIVIIIAGVVLTKNADLLSERLQLGKAWIGIVLLGFVTSLPEAIASLVSIVSLQTYDLAIGNLVGSNNFNPMMLVMMDMIYREGAVTNAIKPHRSHFASASFAIILTLVVITEIFVALPAWGPLSVGSILIVAIYFGGMWRLSKLNADDPELSQEALVPVDKSISLKRIWVSLTISSIVVILGAMVLARSADTIAEQSGLGATFVGSFLLACVTSLPEMVVTVSAVRLGSLDLAIGNVFGSNMTNVFILFFSSLFYTEQPILRVVSSTHALTAFFSIIFTIIVLGGIKIKNKKTFARLGIDSWMLIVLFLGATYVLYQLR